MWFLLEDFYYKKNMGIINKLSIVIILLIALGSCKEIEQLPDRPLIEFTSFAIFDTETYELELVRLPYDNMTAAKKH